MGHMPALQRGVVIGAEVRRKVSVRRKEAFRQRAVPWRADAMSERSADRRFCGPRLFRSHHRHRTVFYRGVETPASFSLRSIFLYRRAPALAAREIHRAWFRPVGASLQASAGTAPFSPDSLGLSPRPPALIFNEHAGPSANEQKERFGLIVDRVRMPSDPRARI